jgi:hypothetical protein
MMFQDQMDQILYLIKSLQSEVAVAEADLYRLIMEVLVVVEALKILVIVMVMEHLDKDMPAGTVDLNGISLQEEEEEQAKLEIVEPVQVVMETVEQD